jgi:apolipoprotein D and lipocalin family protein
LALQTIPAFLAVSAVVSLLAGHAAAEPTRNPSVPLNVVPDYDQSRLLGDWFEVARSESLLENDCQGVTAQVETRDDSRLTLKILCRKGRVTGPALNIDGILVELEPGIFQLRLVRLQQMGDLTLFMLWQAEDDSLAVLGSPLGQVGWVWSKSSKVDPDALALGIEKLLEAGYAEKAIREVKQAH